jgi:hypothetical protein
MKQKSYSSAQKIRITDLGTKKSISKLVDKGGG